jgi:hypothetical protein
VIRDVGLLEKVEESVASIVRLAKMGELGTTLEVSCVSSQLASVASYS